MVVSRLNYKKHINFGDSSNGWISYDWNNTAIINYTGWRYWARIALAQSNVSPFTIKILCTLGNQEISVQDIVEHVGTSQSNISQHLAILRDKGILFSRKDANRVYYKVGDSRTLALIDMMRDVFCTAEA